jgi:hypothetical protein
VGRRGVAWQDELRSHRSPGFRSARQAAKIPSVALHVTSTLLGRYDMGWWWHTLQVVGEGGGGGLGQVVTAAAAAQHLLL